MCGLSNAYSIEFLLPERTDVVCGFIVVRSNRLYRIGVCMCVACNLNLRALHNMDEPENKKELSKSKLSILSLFLSSIIHTRTHVYTLYRTNLCEHRVCFIFRVASHSPGKQKRTEYRLQTRVCVPVYTANGFFLSRPLL